MRIAGHIGEALKVQSDDLCKAITHAILGEMPTATGLLTLFLMRRSYCDLVKEGASEDCINSTMLPAVLMVVVVVLVNVWVTMTVGVKANRAHDVVSLFTAKRNPYLTSGEEGVMGPRSMISKELLSAFDFILAEPEKSYVSYFHRWGHGALLAGFHFYQVVTSFSLKQRADDERACYSLNKTTDYCLKNDAGLWKSVEWNVENMVFVALFTAIHFMKGYRFPFWAKLHAVICDMRNDLGGAFESQEDNALLDECHPVYTEFMSQLMGSDGESAREKYKAFLLGCVLHRRQFDESVEARFQHRVPVDKKQCCFDCCDAPDDSGNNYSLM